MCGFFDVWSPQLAMLATIFESVNASFFSEIFATRTDIPIHENHLLKNKI
jgi:hypothetical protein